MKTEEEYNKITSDRLDKMGFYGENKKTIGMILYWSYVEGSRDADQETFEKLKSAIK